VHILMKILFTCVFVLISCFIGYYAYSQQQLNKTKARLEGEVTLIIKQQIQDSSSSHLLPPDFDKSLTINRKYLSEKYRLVSFDSLFNGYWSFSYCFDTGLFLQITLYEGGGYEKVVQGTMSSPSSAGAEEKCST